MMVPNELAQRFSSKRERGQKYTECAVLSQPKESPRASRKTTLGRASNLSSLQYREQALYNKADWSISVQLKSMPEGLQRHDQDHDGVLAISSYTFGCRLSITWHSIRKL